jgi:hypothetical protein
MRSSIFSTLAILILIFSCSSVSVKYDYDSAIDFKKFTTFGWKEIEIPNDALAKNPLLGKRVKAAVVIELEAKGYAYSESENVDFAVVAHAGTKDRMQITDWGSYGWYSPWWGPYGGRVDVSQYTEGTLVIDIVDMQEKEMAWRGLATGTVDESSNPERSQARIANTISKILANFPPPVK